MMCLKWVLILGTGLALLQAPGTRRASAGPKPVADLPAYTPEREAAALRLVKDHHPELGEVLARLKQLNDEQYRQAIRQLFQEADRLARARASDEKLYELMLESWKVKSRIEVLAARLACGKARDPELEAELKQLLYRQVDLHRQTIEHNRERALATLKVMEANIKLLGDRREEFVERRFRTLTGAKAGPGQ